MGIFGRKTAVEPTAGLADRVRALGEAVEVTGVRRRGGRSRRPDPDWCFEAGDVVVLLGSAEALLTAEERLLKARASPASPRRAS